MFRSLLVAATLLATGCAHALPTARVAPTAAVSAKSVMPMVTSATQDGATTTLLVEDEQGKPHAWAIYHFGSATRCGYQATVRFTADGNLQDRAAQLAAARLLSRAGALRPVSADLVNAAQDALERGSYEDHGGC